MFIRFSIAEYKPSLVVDFQIGFKFLTVYMLFRLIWEMKRSEPLNL